MTENNIAPSRTQPATLPAPVTESRSQATATPAAATAVVNSPSMNGPGEQLPCQWVGCTEKSPNAEALYEHVCERHIGRKSTDNLNLTCQWGTCNTTAVKRDHITSHIRVHVPLKPHRCEFCGKAFKRPQDLKKHVKTHADDSEIRSPALGMKYPEMMFSQNPRGYAAATHYFESPINGVNGQYAHTAPQYYQPHPPPQAANSHSHGNLYYDLSQGQDGNHAYDRKRGYDALNEFFGDLKRRQFDHNSYAAVGQRLLSLQALHGHVPEYQQMAVSVAVGSGGYSASGFQAPGYHLPPLSNVRTKNDLLNIDQFLEQMQNTIYESNENMAAAGVAQPGAHYVHGGMNYRATHCPPTQLTSRHVTATTSAPIMAAQTRFPSVGTPALTPPSSAQSYISQHSPISIHRAHRVSPHYESGAGMYPRLPSASVADSMTTGYPTASCAAPSSTLSGAYDHDDRRRYTGGTLQRARPAERAATEDRMDISQGSKDGERTPTKERPAMHISESLIEPALSGASPNPDQKATQRTTQAATEVAEWDVNVAWVGKVRLLETLRRLVSELLQAGGQTGEAQSTSVSPIPGLDAMEGVDTAGAASEQPKDEPTKVESAVFYPTLRGLDEDGDSKMPGDDA
ncbi:hypothetical protein N7471_013732 [Penicillium samsonianum]|uniref:uncharacterized protein n=1 Tax=Penicillium samsonianum TaxID=1882272 RepID=UPI0025483A71|nr:uncharacterized protein N7471_013732 [Penicillium samsonianum]KAJ6118265.1 hypothetical protein N7471_013732 [Penicillium samsonianum]